MNIKKFVAILFSVAMFMTIAGCSVEKVDDSKSSAGSLVGDVSESPVASATEVTNVPTTVPSAVPTVKPVLDTVPWGEDEFTKILPECTVGAVTQITPGDVLCLVLVEQVEEADAVSYTDKLVQAGFSCADITTDFYTAGRNYVKAGVTVNVVFSAGMMTLMIQK